MPQIWTANRVQVRVLTTYQYFHPTLSLGDILIQLQVNRNKKSIGVSFKDEKGADIIRQLALNADVFVENYLPGTLKKYGLDFSTLSKVNPKLIYASITGYGQTGPYSSRAGYDVMVEA